MSESYWRQLDALVAQSKPPKKPRLTKQQKTELPSAKRTPQTLTETMLIDKLQQCSFPPGSSHKRFIRGLSPNSELSDRGRNYLAYIAHRYRRQWKASAEEFQWIVQYGTWINNPGEAGA